jgi:two-component system response regulator AtoC
MEKMKTILLLDDEQEILTVLGELLDGFGYQVIAKHDAESALSLVREGTRVDLVITDLCMPGMSGSEFISALRQILPSVPVIMLTAFGSVESYIQSRSSGVFEYINKPVPAKELRRIVKAALALPQTQRSSTAS